MKELDIYEIQLVSGGVNCSSLLDATLIGVGGYFGMSLAYFEPLMTSVVTIGPTGTVATLTPHTMIIISAAFLGASMGCALSKGLQAFYHFFQTEG